MDQQKQDVVEKLKAANNILVTVSANPSVDQLAACIGLTLTLNKLKKHATAVFSGAVPSTIEFLKPEETLEKTTDSLRDFIIALDKSKADKLRYKVEENVVKIFITPFRTSITQDDLDFSQGDFNVDVVLCLGVQQQQDLDQAITVHGRILHDAVVVGINTVPGAELATVNWVKPDASSLSELAVMIADALGKDLMDSQIATAFLTGIVAETERFSNDKTSPETMQLSAELMAAGANQQLVANELQAAKPEAFTEVKNDGEALPPDAPVDQDGTLEISHSDSPEPALDLPEPDETHEGPELDNREALFDVKPGAPEADVYDGPEQPADEPAEHPASRIIMQPPSLGGTLTANTNPDAFESANDPLTAGGTPSVDQPLLSHDQPSSASDASTEPQEPAREELKSKPELVIQPPEVTQEPAKNTSTESELPTPEPELAAEPKEPEAPESPEPPSSDLPQNTNEPPFPTSQPLPPIQLQPPVQPVGFTPAPSSDSPQPLDSQIQIDADGNLHMPHAAATTPLPVSDDAVASTGSLTPSAVSDDTQGNQTLTDLEQSVQSPHATQPSEEPKGDVDDARSAVMDAINSVPQPPEPTTASGSTGYLQVQDLPDVADPSSAEPAALSDPAAPPAEPPVLLDEPTPGSSTDNQSTNLPLPPSLSIPPADTKPPTSSKDDPTTPPPVPPPIPLPDMSKYTSPET